MGNARLGNVAPGTQLASSIAFPSQPLTQWPFHRASNPAFIKQFTWPAVYPNASHGIGASGADRDHTLCAPLVFNQSCTLVNLYWAALFSAGQSMRFAIYSDLGGNPAHYPNAKLYDSGKLTTWTSYGSPGDVNTLEPHLRITAPSLLWLCVTYSSNDWAANPINADFVSGQYARWFLGEPELATRNVGTPTGIITVAGYGIDQNTNTSPATFSRTNPWFATYQTVAPLSARLYCDGTFNPLIPEVPFLPFVRFSVS